MSFGFSVGDFIAVIELANRIRKEFARAPSQFKNISDECVSRARHILRLTSQRNRVRSLSIVLQDVDTDLSDFELDDEQKEHLGQILDSCRNVLTDLEKKLDKFGELESGTRNSSKKLNRVWKSFKWESQDIQELRNRIISNITLLNGFMERISGYIKDSLMARR